MFGREPRAGRVKTRLARTVGGAAAAALYAELLAHTLEEAHAASSRVTLFVAEPPSAQWSVARAEAKFEGHPLEPIDSSQFRGVERLGFVRG